MPSSKAMATAIKPKGTKLRLIELDPSTRQVKTIIELDRNKYVRLTRFQSNEIAKIFRFLDLPAEIRHIIYNHALSLKGVETFFNNYYAQLKDKPKGALIWPRLHARRTPTILLLNRQITSEARAELKRMTVRFDHGLLDICGISKSNGPISQAALRNIGTIVISTNGHPTLEGNHKLRSFFGYTNLLIGLFKALKGADHQLRKLEVNLSDKGLGVHLRDCWDSPIKCDFRDNLKHALGKLRGVRGVKEVVLKGVDAQFARELKFWIQKKPFEFLVDVPGELRNWIYEYCGDYSSITKKFNDTVIAWPDTSKPCPFPALSTPNVLRLNKQIAREAASYLQGKPLNLKFPGPEIKFPPDHRIPNFTRFIHVDTVSKIQKLAITIDAWQWMYCMRAFIEQLGARHSLKEFKLHFTDPDKDAFLKAQTYNYPDGVLHDIFADLKTIRGVEVVSITGDLPAIYSDALAEAMRLPASATTLPVLKAIRGNGEVVDADLDED